MWMAYQLLRVYPHPVRKYLRYCILLLETIKIQNPDGSIIDVKQRHDEKMKNNDSKAEQERNQNINN